MKIYTEEGLDKILEGITVDIEIKKRDKVLPDDYSGTFLVDSNGLCFRALNCHLEDYKEGDKIKANYIGPSNTENIKNLPWKEVHFNHKSRIIQ